MCANWNDRLSLLAERDHRVNSRGTPRREIGRRHRGHRERRQREADAAGIAWTQTEQHGCDDPCHDDSHGKPEALAAMIPDEHRRFVTDLLDEAGIPRRPEELGGPVMKAAGLNVDAEAPGQVEVSLQHPGVKMLVNALGPPPPDVVNLAHEHGLLA